MKYLLNSILLCQGVATSAFVVTNRHSFSGCQQRDVLKTATASSLLFASTQDEDEEIKSTSFDEAGKSIIDAQDEERMRAMGDFDSNQSFQDTDVEKMRAAIRERAAQMGVEKQDQSWIEEAKQRAMEEAQNRRQSGGLDLSQISTGKEPGAKGEKWDESLPTMMYDPADYLTAEEQAEADKVGQLPIWEQAMVEIKASTWPDFGAVIRRLALLTAVVAVTGALIIGFDSFLRDLYTGLGMIPRPEDIPGQMQDLGLPEGFTNNMNEDDLARITQEMNQAGKAAGLSSESLNTLMESQNLDLTNPDL